LQAFEKHIKEFYASDDFKATEKAAQPFFRAAKDFVFGRPTTLENMVSQSLVPTPDVSRADSFYSGTSVVDNNVSAILVTEN
jgi:hypothetical protein